MSAVLKKLGEKLQNCQKCGLSQSRTNMVFGEGDTRAEIMFIGEGPGQREDELGRPFVGAAGKLLDEMLESVDLERKEVYIANVVKCRPPNNRDPLPDEVEACLPNLEKQVKEIKPKLIVLLGRHSLERFLPKQKISLVHGKALRRELPGLGKKVFFASYHPAAALYQQSLKETLFRDFRQVPRIIKMIKEGKTVGSEKRQPKQKPVKQRKGREEPLF